MRNTPILRAVVSALLIFGFFAAYAVNVWRKDGEADDIMNGAVIAAFNMAIGHWLGSSHKDPP
jgi:uncharacterized BrkB/YihY/UPF0761 family membrane protein